MLENLGNWIIMVAAIIALVVIFALAALKIWSEMNWFQQVVCVVIAALAVVYLAVTFWQITLAIIGLIAVVLIMLYLWNRSSPSGY